METSTFLPSFWNFLHTASRHCSQGDNKYPASEKCNRHSFCWNRASCLLWYPPAQPLAVPPYHLSVQTVPDQEFEPQVTRIRSPLKRVKGSGSNTCAQTAYLWGEESKEMTGSRFPTWESYLLQQSPALLGVTRKTEKEKLTQKKMF